MELLVMWTRYKRARGWNILEKRLVSSHMNNVLIKFVCVEEYSSTARVFILPPSNHPRHDLRTNSPNYFEHLLQYLIHPLLPSTPILHAHSHNHDESKRSSTCLLAFCPGRDYTLKLPQIQHSIRWESGGGMQHIPISFSFCLLFCSESLFHVLLCAVQISPRPCCIFR